MTNETGSYEAALEKFASGKKLARLAKFVRARGNDHCDACGSTLPRLLFGLKDAQTERCYFVGHNCLNWLLEARLVARARFRQSSETAYEREMKLRGNGHADLIVDADQTVMPHGPTALLTDRDVTPAGVRAPGRWVRQDGAFIFERPEMECEPALLLIAIFRSARPSQVRPST